MKIKSITQRPEHVDVYDIETPCHNYILANGVISHNTMEMFSKTVVSGGQGNILAANDIIVVGRQQDSDKKTKELKGYDFILNIDKSRTVREKRKIPMKVSFDYGVLSYDSMVDISIEAGLIINTGGAWYAWVDQETGEIQEGKKFQRKDASAASFWDDKLGDPTFEKRLEDYYRLDSHSLLAKKEAGMLVDAIPDVEEEQDD